MQRRVSLSRLSVSAIERDIPFKGRSDLQIRRCVSLTETRDAIIR